GKTTLARVLGKIDPADVGTVMQRRGSRIGYLPQVPQLDESVNAIEAALRGLERWQTVRHEYDLLSQKLAASGSGTAESSQALLDRQAELTSQIEQMG